MMRIRLTGLEVKKGERDVIGDGSMWLMLMLDESAYGVGLEGRLILIATWR